MVKADRRPLGFKAADISCAGKARSVFQNRCSLKLRVLGFQADCPRACGLSRRRQPGRKPFRAKASQRDYARRARRHSYHRFIRQWKFPLMALDSILLPYYKVRLLNRAASRG